MLRTRTKVGIGIGILIFLTIFAIYARVVDTKRVEQGEKPMFCMQMAEVADGGSKIYIGLGYKVIAYNQKNGYQGMVIGGWNLEYDADYEVSQFPILTAQAKSPDGQPIQNETENTLYVVSVHQKAEHTILVKASSNLEDFKGMEYEIETEETITKEDVKIDWLTLQGKAEASTEDPFAVAIVTITKKEKEISKKKIDFVANIIQG